MTASPYVPRALRREVEERARLICEYCRSQQDLMPGTFEIDHVVPHSLGGETVSKNLCLACPICNGHKALRTVARDPVTGRGVALFNPRTQSWDRHFEWSGDYAEILGKTPTGRATIVALKMNELRIVRLRRVFAELGWHPPADL